MLSKEEMIMLQHYLKEGLPKTVIANKLGISRKTVQRHVNQDIGTSGYQPRPAKPTLLDRYRDYVRDRLALYPELTAARLLTEIQTLGYAGKYTQLKAYVRLIRPRLPVEIEQRFEVTPGQQAQVDFATFKTDFGTVYALLVVLSWSRVLWSRFYFHQDQITVLGGLNRAFIAFGGVPQTVLFDRMKTAVASSDPDGRAIFNDEMLRFALHHGFRPVACRPYRAKTKGRVERAVSYLRQGFFYGRHFRDLADLNDQLEHWLSQTANVRVHGTTGEIPANRLAQERSHLLPLPLEAYQPVITVGRRMSRDGYVAYNGNDYSLPTGLLSPEITVMATLEEIRLYQSDQLVAVHHLLEGKGQRRLDPRHPRNPQLNQGNRQAGKNIWELIEVETRPLDVYEEVLR